MKESLPGLVVTGASGFVGRHILASVAGKYRLFCLARRSRQEAGVPDYPDMRWTQVDVAEWDKLRDVLRCIKDHGGADYVLHLAGYYDFHNMENPEYERTNVRGTRNVLKLARQLGVKRFIFASSLAACRFPEPGHPLDEDAPADATFAYARSKHEGEKLVRQEAEWFPSAVVRMAAVFSDWCEYPPLYVLMRTWLSEGWEARILAGRGESAVPYIHVQDLARFFLRVIERSDELPRFVIYNASPNRTGSHRELHEAVTRYFYGEARSPRFIPRWLCAIGLVLRWRLGRLLGHQPFEAPWMAEYIDKKLLVDARRTQAALDWAPTARLDINRRLLLMVDNMKAQSEVWRQRNEEALRRAPQRPNLVIVHHLELMREQLVDRILEEIRLPGNAHLFPRHQELKPDALRWSIMFVYQVLISATRARDKRLVRQYARAIALSRYREGFAVEQVQGALTLAGEIIVKGLSACPELTHQQQHIYDYVNLSFQLACDGVADAYEVMLEQGPERGELLIGSEPPMEAADLQQMVRQLEDLCEDAAPAFLGPPR
jgi:nucleoside-diphosphate-sugar epimerase